jgi:RimJ/RimL family protein N-acetyltransferase
MLVRDGDRYILDEKFVVIPSKDQDLLATCYLRMKAEKLLDVMFYEEIPNLCRYMEMMLKEGSVFLALFQIERTGAYTLIGFGGTSNPVSMGGGYCKAEMYCLFFKEYQRRNISFPVAQMMMAWCYERIANLDVMFGTTPAPNVAMVRFAKALGFKMSKIDNFTTWKGEPCAVWISCLTDQEFRLLVDQSIPHLR